MLELVAVPRIEPPVGIPRISQPSCQEPSDGWAFATHAMIGGGEGLGAEYLHVYLWNNRIMEEAFSFQLSGLGAIHWAEIVAGPGRFEGSCSCTPVP